MNIRQGKGYYIFGALKNVYMEAASYISAMQFAIICIMAYTTTLEPWLTMNNMVIPLWGVLTIFTGVIISILLFTYKIGIPSHYKFLERQFREHGNFTAEDMKKLFDNQKCIMSKSGIKEKTND